MKSQAEVQQKATKMKQKTEYVAECCKIPDTEKVIQDYRCTMKRGNISVGGKLFITQNYIVFISSDMAVTVSISNFKNNQKRATIDWVGHVGCNCILQS